MSQDPIWEAKKQVELIYIVHAGQHDSVNATSSIVIVAIVMMVVVMMIPAIVVIVIAVRAVMMMVMMPPTVMVMVIIAVICAGSPRMSAMGPKTEIGPRNPDFRSSLNSRHSPTRRSRPKSANSDHRGGLQASHALKRHGSK